MGTRATKFPYPDNACKLGIKTPIHQYVQHTYGLSGAIAPRVIRAALDHHVARFQVRFGIVKQQGDFTFQHV